MTSTRWSCSLPENFYYVTNFLLDVDTWERPVAAIIPRDGTPKLVLNQLSTTYLQLAAGRGTCWVTDAEIYAEHPQVSRRGYLITEWDRMLAEVLADMGLDRGQLGFDRLGLLHPGVPARLPRAELTEVAGLLQSLRSIKSDEEIALMQTCGRPPTGPRSVSVPTSSPASTSSRRAWRSHGSSVTIS